MSNMGVTNMGMWEHAVNMGVWQDSYIDVSREMTASIQHSGAYSIDDIICGPKYTGLPTLDLAMEGAITSHE